jgi:hypothetical protein
MADLDERRRDIAIAYQSGMEDGARLDRSMDDADITALGVERGERWAAAAVDGSQYPEPV